MTSETPRSAAVRLIVKTSGPPLGSGFLGTLQRYSTLITDARLRTVDEVRVLPS